MARRRREFAAAVLGCLLGSTLILLAAGRPWVAAVAVQEPLRVDLSVKGASLSPAVPACALVCLAGTVGVLAARAVARRLIGLVIAAAGIGAVIASILGADPGAAELADRAGATVGTATATATGVETTAWPWLAVLGGGLCAAAGLLAALRGAAWPGMSSRYERTDVHGAPGAHGVHDSPAPVEPSAQTALDQWRALDRGEDPTV